MKDLIHINTPLNAVISHSEIGKHSWVQLAKNKNGELHWECQLTTFYAKYLMQIIQNKFGYKPTVYYFERSKQPLRYQFNESDLDVTLEDFLNDSSRNWS